MSSSDPTSSRYGVATGVLAFLMWGVAPLFWREIRQIPSEELLAHRALWSAFCFVVVLGARKELDKVLVVYRDPRQLRILALSTLLIACNWFTFVYAIQTDRLLHASFGYFINPMVNIVCGLLIFRESLNPLQKVAVLVVLLGIGVRSCNMSDFPWISFVLAGSFAAYGVVRKKAQVDAITGNAIETFNMAPLALGFLLWLSSHESLQFLHAGDRNQDLLLLLTGPVTLLPMLCFSLAARSIPLSWVGQLQYISPTMQFLLAVFYFNETSDTFTWVGFSLVWLGLALSVLSTLKKPAIAPARA